MKRWRIAGINFDHMHMGDLLRMVQRHPQADLVGVSHEVLDNKIVPVVEKLGIPKGDVYTDYRQCLERSKPDLVILCPATGRHAEWTEKVAPFGVHVLMEKPFASSVADADRMTAAMAATGKTLAINWPLRWYGGYQTVVRLIDEGAIGPVTQVHFYNGNRGPLRHVADKEVVPEDVANAEKAKSWFYKKAEGGGSLLDYLGYGTTLGTWLMGGRAPIEVTATTDQPAGLEVDEHAIVVARYDTGLSKFETRWGTFTDPWLQQPQPKCGFVVVGRNGTISSYDREPTVRLQTRDDEAGRDIPADPVAAPFDNPVNYVLDRLSRNAPIEGPLSPAVSRTGQRIVDAAVRSAAERRTVPLPA